MTHHLRAWLLCTGAAAAGLVLAAAPAGAQSTTPPDLSVCDGVGCDTVQDSVCSAAGFENARFGLDEIRKTGIARRACTYVNAGCTK